MDRIEDLATFIAAVETGSLTAAARRLNRSLQAVSRSLAALEHELGVELLRRTTRRSNPTEAGATFYRRIKPVLAEIEEAKREAANLTTEPTGSLRISASSAFAPRYVVPAIAAFLALHPKLEIDLELSDAYVDLIEGGFDLAIRIGEMPDSTLRTRYLAHSRRVVFAAPDYLARHGRPLRPDQLTDHQCIVRTASRDGDAWPFVMDGKTRLIRIGGRFRASGAAAANEAAVLGIGIANAPLWQVRDLVEQGRVALILMHFEPPPIPIRVVWAATRLAPAKTRLFVQFLAERLRSELL